MTSKTLLSLLAVAGATLLTSPAWADIPPDDVCLDGDEGKACDNAEGPGGAPQPGICTSTTCTRATPSGSMTYDCYRCLAPAGGAGGTPNEPGGAGGAVEPGPGGAGSGAQSSGGSAAGSESTAGSSVGGSGGSSAGSSSQAGTKTTNQDDDDSGCSVAAVGAAGGVGGLLLALGLLGAGVFRRRTPRS